MFDLFLRFCLFSSPDKFQRNFPKGYLLIIQTCSNGILITPLMRMIRFFVVLFIFTLIKYSQKLHLQYEATVYVENKKNKSLACIIIYYFHNSKHVILTCFSCQNQQTRDVKSLESHVLYQNYRLCYYIFLP